MGSTRSPLREAPPRERAAVRYTRLRAGVAQSAEQRFRKPQVRGSSPLPGSRLPGFKMSRIRSGPTLLESAPMRHRPLAARLFVFVSIAPSAVVASAPNAAAQVIVSPNAEPVRNDGGWIYWVAIALVALGVIVTIGIILRYMRNAPRWQREEGGPRVVKAPRIQPGREAPLRQHHRCPSRRPRPGCRHRRRSSGTCPRPRRSGTGGPRRAGAGRSAGSRGRTRTGSGDGCSGRRGIA